ncbi:hypothetical protein ACW5XF_06015 [Aeromonas lusitana]|uniref:Uncharacterized protein n=1 Tax=Aeromonas lusitana TaxID=931529 RepID=A0A2M8H9M0_9GAMM|nr:hypothetical protein [Aeromonas lusitana]PJC93266.1 hypothetical protein CUC44_09980 [Aeromonas lusitana]
MSDMMLLARAQALLGHHPFTLADARALEALEEDAVGEEGLCIAELWESALSQADEDARRYLLGKE